MEKRINRIKAIFTDKGRTNKWLAEQLNCAPAIASKWCTNTSQPPIETFIKISELVEISLDELVRIEKN